MCVSMTTLNGLTISQMLSIVFLAELGSIAWLHEGNKLHIMYTTT